MPVHRHTADPGGLRDVGHARAIGVATLASIAATGLGLGFQAAAGAAAVAAILAAIAIALGVTRTVAGFVH